MGVGIGQNDTLSCQKINFIKNSINRLLDNEMWFGGGPPSQIKEYTVLDDIKFYRRGCRVNF
jgi:hypothetical protein